jgi:hypothetical protein
MYVYNSEKIKEKNTMYSKHDIMNKKEEKLMLAIPEYRQCVHVVYRRSYRGYLT